MPLPVTLRPLIEADHDFVLDLNHRHVEKLSPLDVHRLRDLIDWSDRADLIEVDGAPAGFVITMAAGTTYDSENYRWYADHYDDFYYLDRVVIAPEFRRTGAASAAYDELEASATPHGRMLLEVNLEPPNEASLAFHHRRGYRELHRLGEPGHVVTLLGKGFDASSMG